MLVKVLTDKLSKAGCLMNGIFKTLSQLLMTFVLAFAAFAQQPQSPQAQLGEIPEPVAATPIVGGQTGYTGPSLFGITDTLSRPMTRVTSVVRSMGTSMNKNGAQVEITEIEYEQPSNSVAGLTIGNNFFARKNHFGMCNPFAPPIEECPAGESISQSSPFGPRIFDLNNIVFRSTASLVGRRGRQLPRECPLPNGNNITMDVTCGCVIAKNQASNPIDRLCNGDSGYKPMSPDDAKKMCQKVVGTGIVNNFSGLIGKYNHSAVIGEILKVAGYGAVSCNSAGMGDQFTDTYSQDDTGSGKRKCSVQAVGFVVNQIEQTAKSCSYGSPGGFVAPNCPISPELVRSLDTSNVDQRNLDFKELLKLTRELPATTGVEVDSARAELRAKYEKYVKETKIGQSFKSFIEGRVSSVMKEGFGCDPKESATCPDPSTLPDKKRKSVEAILKYISSITDPNEKKEFEDMYPVISGLPSYAEVIQNPSILKDEDLDQVLSFYNGQVASQCLAAKADLLTSCKQVTSGNLFDLDKSAQAACENPEIMKQKITGNHLRLSVWKQIMAQQFGTSDKATTQQFMCAAQYNFQGLSEDDNAACEPRVLEDLADQFKNPEFRNKSLLGLQSTSEYKYEDVLAAFNSCNPFAPENEPLQQRNLNDEQDPYTQGNPLAAATQMQEERKREASGQGIGLNLNSPRTLGSQESNGYTPGGLTDISESTRREFTSRTPRGTTTEASNFYNSMDSRKLEEMTSSFVSQYASSDLDTTSRSPASINAANADDELDKARDALAGNDALLAQLDELARKNKELNERLKAMQIKEITDENGNAVSVEDAFNKTNDKIAEQKAKALAERKLIEEKEKRALEFVERNSQGSTTNTNTTQNNPNARLGENDDIPQRSNGGTNSTGVTSSGSVGSSNNGGRGSTGSSDGANVDYGPVPFTGITLNADTLSIAKPLLDLGGQSIEERPDIVSAAISAVKSALDERSETLPAYTIDGKLITEYIVQEQDGKDVIVYLDGDKVKIQEILVALESTQAVVDTEIKEDEVEAVVVEPTPARAPAFESSGRKNMDLTGEGFDNELNKILDNAQ